MELDTGVLLTAAWTVAALAAFEVARRVVAWLRRAAALRRSGIPSPPILSPISGHVGAILSERAPFILGDWAEHYGPVMLLRVLHQHMVVVSDPAESSKILRRSSKPAAAGGGGGYVPKARAVYASLEIGVKPRTANILTEDDAAPLWKAVRAAVAPAFSATSLRQALPRLNALTARVGDRLEAAGGGDVADLSKRLTSDLMGTLLFDEDLGGVEGRRSEYLELFNLVLLATHARFVNPLRPLAPLFDAQARREEAAVRRHDAVIGAKVDAVLARPPPDWTIAAHLLRVVDPSTGKRLDRARLKAEVSTVFGAGFETTSHALTWALRALAAHPEAQDTLAKELAAAGLAPTAAQPVPRAFEFADLNRLPYLMAVVRETLRLFSPASLGTTRLTTAPTTIGGYEVPAGVMVMVAPGCTSLQSRLYGATAREFDPSRWLPAAAANGGGSKGAAAAAAAGGGAAAADAARDVAPQADQDGVDGAAAANATAAPPVPDSLNLAFSEGPRSCVGLPLAMLELQAVVATLVGRLRFDSDERGAAPLLAAAAYHVTLGAKGGRVHLRASPREPVAL